MAVVRLNFVKKNNRFRRNKQPFSLPQAPRTYSRMNNRATRSPVPSPFKKASTMSAIQIASETEETGFGPGGRRTRSKTF